MIFYVSLPTPPDPHADCKIVCFEFINITLKLIESIQGNNKLVLLHHHPTELSMMLLHHHHYFLILPHPFLFQSQLQTTELNTLLSMKMSADKNSDEDRRSAGMTTRPASSPANLPLSPSFLDYTHEPSNFSTSSTEDGDLEKNRRTKKHHGKKIRSFAYRVQDHVKMGPKLSETVKGKLQLGVKIIQKGGRENIFKQVFGEIQGEKLLKASQCYLSTTECPIAGILFISTQKLAFYSDRSITLPSPNDMLGSEKKQKLY